MSWFLSKFKWVLVISGALTLTMVHALFAPHSALRSNFGETLEGPVAEIVVRNWGALIALMGAMSLYAAWHPEVRRLVVTVAGTSKLVFIVLILVYGRTFLGKAVGIGVALDALWVLLFAAWLIGSRSRAVEAPPSGRVH
jgi:hypothetical protein